jgi:hypothetical protein
MPFQCFWISSYGTDSDKSGFHTTALGLDWFQASLAGKAFRLIQYVIEISMVISLFKVIFNYHEPSLKP